MRVLDVKEKWERGDNSERLRYYVKKLGEVP